MMSRIISAVCIAAFITFVCILSAKYASDFTDDIADQTTKLHASEEVKIEELQKKWKKYNEYAALYYDHEELEEVTALICKLKEYDTSSEMLFRIDCREIEAIMQHLKESQIPKLNNIF